MAFVTQLREYYDALCALKEEEQTALAEFHVDDPQSLLAYRFRKSVQFLEGKPRIDDSFYPSGRTDLPKLVEKIERTPQFASHLCGGDKWTVDDDVLSFRYVDAELSPRRTTAAEGRVPRRSLDLLLANWHDQTPIFAEVKIGADKLAYFALVQTLMLAVEFLVPDSQRDRLSAHPPAAECMTMPDHGPYADLYVILYRPASSDNRRRSFDATERIAERLIQDNVFSEYIRRIAYLEAPGDRARPFRKLFAF